MKNNFEQSDQYEPKVIAEEIDETLAELDALLLEDRFQSEEEKNSYLRKLYGLLSASNNDRVREMIRYIETEYKK
ncbi:MAG: hypothetical protein KBC35_02600 [Candidatus Pacebacteria bacterium]|jgi:hypothetical protein|nr:hypothetical protein [Candidatus Paceibacterota bacterium]